MKYLIRLIICFKQIIMIILIVLKIRLIIKVIIIFIYVVLNKNLMKINKGIFVQLNIIFKELSQVIHQDLFLHKSHKESESW